MTFDEWWEQQTQIHLSGTVRIPNLEECWKAATNAALDDAAKVVRENVVVWSAGKINMVPVEDMPNMHGDRYAAAIEALKA